nr:hypothetical protein [Tanacetum cinerariifolium]
DTINNIPLSATATSGGASASSLVASIGLTGDIFGIPSIAE